MKNRQSFSFEASAPDNLLKHWPKVFHGRVEGDKIVLQEGVMNKRLIEKNMFS